MSDKISVLVLTEVEVSILTEIAHKTPLAAEQHHKMPGIIRDGLSRGEALTRRLAEIDQNNEERA